MRKVNALGRMKRRLSTNSPGITVGVIAMLVALTGVAFAGTGALTGKQKKEVKALIKKEAKQGPAGSVGAPGPKGDPGLKGDTGAKGDPGGPGASVNVTSVPTGDQECAELGGALVEKEGSGSPKEVCNGEKGSNGAPGSPWTAGGTLPAAGMLTGSWTVSGSGFVDVPLSFPIHLAERIPASKIYYGAGEEGETVFLEHCAEGALEPKVLAGNPGTLCIYYFFGTSTAATFEGVTRTGSELNPGTSLAGAFLSLNITTPGAMYGTYAVSGE